MAFLLYADLQYNPDEPWEGLSRNEILVKVMVDMQRF
jgi:hypothetical protein